MYGRDRPEAPYRAGYYDWPCESAAGGPIATRDAPSAAITPAGENLQLRSRVVREVQLAVEVAERRDDARFGTV